MTYFQIEGLDKQLAQQFISEANKIPHGIPYEIVLIVQLKSPGGRFSGKYQTIDEALAAVEPIIKDVAWCDIDLRRLV